MAGRDVVGLVLLDVPAGQATMSAADVAELAWDNPSNHEHVDYVGRRAADGAAPAADPGDTGHSGHREGGLVRGPPRSIVPPAVEVHAGVVGGSTSDECDLCQARGGSPVEFHGVYAALGRPPRRVAATEGVTA